MAVHRSTRLFASHVVGCWAVALGAAACGGTDDAFELAHASVPITHGLPTLGDAAVGALLARGDTYCSGVLVAPRMVLSSAHCVHDGMPDAVSFERVDAIGERTERLTAHVARVWRHPEHASGSSDFDLGVLLLGEDVPIEPTPLPVTSLTASNVGLDVRLVGYGEIGADSSVEARKREGNAVLSEISSSSLLLAPAPSLACHGDSGAAVFARNGEQESLIGLVSKGDEDCRRWTRATRLDGLAAPFVTDLARAIEARGRRLGEPCVESANCASASCVAPRDAPSFAYCSADCSAHRSCEPGMVCRADSTEAPSCRWPKPSPGASGGRCSVDADCESGFCARFVDGRRAECSTLCFPEDREPCAGPASCAPVSDEDAAGLWACRTDAVAVAPNGCGMLTVSSVGGCLLGLPHVLLVLRIRRRARFNRGHRQHAPQVASRQTQP